MTLRIPAQAVGLRRITAEADVTSCWFKKLTIPKAIEPSSQNPPGQLRAALKSLIVLEVIVGSLPQVFRRSARGAIAHRISIQPVAGAFASA